MGQYSGFLQRLARNEAGNTLALMAAAMVPFTILVGSGVDLAVAYMARGKLQNACDAGVLAARQSMEGTVFDSAVEAEADRFFDFNFPDATAGSTDIEFEVTQDDDDETQLFGSASANVPTTLMRITGVNEIPISVSCDAKRDMGHNDIMLVLDVTGSMLCAPGVASCKGPSEQAGSKIGRLRTGAAGIYRGLDSDDGSIIRFGIMPYSSTVNVARSLKNKDILKDQFYVRTSTTLKTVHINQSSWNNGQGGGESGNTEAFRMSGNGCIEERPSVGNSLSPFRIENTITREDVDTQAGNAGNQPELQFGRYDAPAHTNSGYTTQDGIRFYTIASNSVQTACPSEATKLQEYADEGAFQTAINLATARVTGGTYHDVGILWGLRFLSRTGFFSADNPTEIDDIPVNQHIVFMTDGMLGVGDTLYSAHGIEKFEKRTQGSGSQAAKHLARFEDACDLAKSMKITVWVIALDVGDTSDIEPCATSPAHFYPSDGSDLEEVFEKIGRGIGNLRLTR
jgi:hypothetical protein